MPSTGPGATGSPGGGGSSTSSQLPPVSRSPLPRTRPSTTTLPASATSAALVRESPKSRVSAWSTRCPSSPSGTGSARYGPEELVTPPIVTACGGRAAHCPSRAGERRPVPGPGVAVAGPGRAVVACARAVELDAAQRQDGAQDPAADDGGVGDVEDRPRPSVGPEDGDEVHDRTAQHAVATEHPVDEVAQRAAEHQAQRHRPA